MLRLLKKVRSNLLKENRLKSYGLYAIGEIILVVAGILIAVKINNWNTQNTFNKIEEASISRLKEDLQQDIKRFDFLESRFSNRLKACDSTLQLIANQKTLEDRLNIIAIHQINFFLVEANTTTYDEMLNTGRLYSMRDQNLRAQINKYYRDVKKWSRYVEKDNEQLRIMMVQPNFNDYWAVQEKIWANTDVNIKQYKWLTQQFSKEMTDIESLIITAEDVFMENRGAVRHLKKTCEELIDSIK